MRIHLVNPSDVAFIVFGGIHSTLYPAEAQELGAAQAVVKGDGDVIWSTALADCLTCKFPDCPGRQCQILVSKHSN